jgi:beta-lactamase superfamily II metal-dependent hydrolase
MLALATAAAAAPADRNPSAGASLPKAEETVGAKAAQNGLDIYFVDTEGGAATLIVSPAGEATLIDDGNAGTRDAERIAAVAKLAGLKQIDNLIITHWHNDHFGGTEHLATLLPIKHFYNRGIIATLADDPEQFPKLMAAYQAASQGNSVTLNPGDNVSLAQAGPELRLHCLCARGEVEPDRPGAPENKLGQSSTPMPVDTSDNAQSLGFLLSYGGFRFLDLGDLTWNNEAKLVTPTDKIGPIDVYLSTHHGLNISNNPVVIRTVRPTVAIFNNGPHKGGHPDLTATLRSVGSVKDIWQLHRNLDAKPEENTRPEFIANSEPTESCKGEFIKLSVAPDASSYTVQIGAKGKARKYRTRQL